MEVELEKITVFDILERYNGIIDKVIKNYQYNDLETRMPIILTDVVYGLKQYVEMTQLIGKAAVLMPHENSHLTIPILTFIISYEKRESYGVFIDIDKVEETKKLLQIDGINLKEEDGIITAQFEYENTMIHSKFTYITNVSNEIITNKTLLVETFSR